MKASIGRTVIVHGLQSNGAFDHPAVITLNGATVVKQTNGFVNLFSVVGAGNSTKAIGFQFCGDTLPYAGVGEGAVNECNFRLFCSHGMSTQ